ncbi:hypothetical protein Q5P01_018060 [Channa striata]|uniref:Uncharacterized protein n=1 Tax=Channa striata TaxID=64152 RepID=A0AA88M4A9_CHASR|nr:hypothetical protein Q5P01_018060 [Channa striata]
MIVHLNGENNETEVRTKLQTLNHQLSRGRKGKHLISSTMCVSQNTGIKDSLRYYGVSMSTSGAIAGQIMVAASCLNYWDNYVADAVMTYYINNMKNKDFDGTITVPEIISPPVPVDSDAQNNICFRRVNVAAVWYQRARMADVSVSRELVNPDFQQCSRAEGEKYLLWVKEFVLANEHRWLKLKNPQGSVLRIAGLENTIYSGKDEEVNAWGEFYLPEIVNMEVVGLVDGTSCPCDQLVLMTCEDKNVYAYDGEDLHLVASSLKELCDKGLKYPASKIYYNGEAFKDMTDKDWAKLWKGEATHRRWRLPKIKKLLQNSGIDL